MRTFRSSVAIPLALAGALVAPASASALQIGVHDQGVAPGALIASAGLLGASDARIIARAGEPHTDLVRAYRQAGMRVQAAVLVKRDTTAGDIRWLMRQWDGDVQTVSIGNEPELNGVSPRQYARLYRRAYLMLRREFPRVRIGFGEFSPNSAMEYLRLVLKAPGPRLRADFLAIHPYQMRDDPLAVGPEIQATGLHWGMGRLGRVTRELRSKRVRARLATRTGRPLPVWCTEFSYLTTGRYRVTPDKAAWLWPRAIKQARKHCRQLVIYGLGAVHEGSAWGSGSLIGPDGRRLPAFHAIARALGRTLPDEPGPAVPPPFVNPPPGPSIVVPPAHGEGRAIPPIGSGASSEEPQPEPDPVIIEDPPLVELEPEPVDPEPVETPAEEPVEAP